jgi:Domain of unknown function (DUF4037)
MADFIPGRELARLFFEEAVKPVLDAEFPDLRYDAGLIDSGSEVLGYDTPLSRDHHWGPRVSLFVSEVDQVQYASAINEIFRHKLPYRFHGYPTSFEPIPDEPHILRFAEVETGPVNHRVGVVTLKELLGWYLGWDWRRDVEIEVVDWLTFPQQKLRTLTQGPVFHNGLGDLAAMRDQLGFYPRDVWFYLLAAGWMRISQEEPFVGRCGDVGDDLGSRVIAARLVRDLMMLGFLMERQYAPYSKWFGTAFSRLACAGRLTPIFHQVFSAENWQERETYLCEAYAIVAEMHNGLGITERLPTEVSLFHERPYHVIHGERFSEAIRVKIQDENVKRIAAATWIGSVNLLSDNSDLLENQVLREKLKALY